MNDILIISNNPIEEYQKLCVKLFKRYCIIHDMDFIFMDEYKYNKKYKYIVYIDNTELILNMDVNIKDYMKDEYDLIYPNNYKTENKFIIIKNNGLYLKYINNINSLKQKIDINRTFIITEYFSITNHSHYSINDSLDNPLFLENLKESRWLFYCNNDDVISLELKNYIYYQTFNKIYNNKNFFDIDINYNKYNYDGDIEIFNPNKNIAFVTLYTKEIKDEGKEMEYSLKEYCVKNDYTCYIHRKSELVGKRHPTLEKPYLLKKYLDRHDYIIWVDSDILMFNQKFKIEEILNNKYDLIVFKDPNPLNLFNAGFLIFRKSKDSLNIINKWIFEIEEKNVTVFGGKTVGDQGLLIDVVEKEYLNNVLISDNSEINSVLNNYNVTNVKVLHLMGIFGFVRPVLMKYLNYIIFVKNKPLYLTDDKQPHLGGSIEGGDNGTWAPELWDFLFNDLSIKSMLDVGCGEGLSMKYFKDKNVDILGIEGLQESINRSKVKEFIIHHDYTKGNVLINKNYDLCWSCEFVEHVDEQYMNNFIDTFKKSKYVAMTHAFPNQAGYHHVNCQNAEYWINILEKNNFKYNNEYSIKLKNITNNNAIHIKRSLLFFENKNIN